jgi:hypothetical protein
MALAVATAQITNFRPRHPGLTGLPECCGDHMFSSPGDNDAEEITPDRQSCIKVLHGNLVSSVEQRLEES